MSVSKLTDALPMASNSLLAGDRTLPLQHHRSKDDQPSGNSPLQAALHLAEVEQGVGSDDQQETDDQSRPGYGRTDVHLGSEDSADEEPQRKFADDRIGIEGQDGLSGWHEGRQRGEDDQDTDMDTTILKFGASKGSQQKADKHFVVQLHPE